MANNAAQQQYQQPQVQYQQPRRNGGRGGGRGGGGRSNTSNGRGWQQQAWQQMQQMPIVQQPNQSFGNKNMNANRYYDNPNYCSTCGSHVEEDHTSMTCTTPGPRHDINATLANQMGGSTRGAHKTIPPAQCGYTPNHMPQKAASQQYLAWRASGFQGPAPTARNMRVSTQRRQNGAQQQHQPAYQQQQPVYQQANMMHQQMPMMQQVQQMQPMMQPMLGGMQMPPEPMQQQQQQQNQAMGSQNRKFAGYGMGAPMGRNFCWSGAEESIIFNDEFNVTQNKTPPIPTPQSQPPPGFNAQHITCSSYLGQCNYILPDIAEMARKYSAIENKSKEYSATTISSSAGTGANYDANPYKPVLDNLNMPQKQLNAKDVCPYHGELYQFQDWATYERPIVDSQMPFEFNWGKKNTTSYQGTPTRYGFANTASSMLATINFNLEDIKQWAILDSGATSHFLCTDAEAKDVRPTNDPITVTIPDGTKLTSTHTRELDLPNLPKAARTGHILPGMSAYSLISVVTLCNAGCRVTFDMIGVTVTHRGRLVMEGRKCTRTGLWMVPISRAATEKGGKTPTITPMNNFTLNEQQGHATWYQNAIHSHFAGNIIQTSSKAELAAYHHQSLGSPPISAILRAMTNHPDELATFPGLDANLIK